MTTSFDACYQAQCAEDEAIEARDQGGWRRLEPENFVVLFKDGAPVGFLLLPLGGGVAQAYRSAFLAAFLLMQHPQLVRTEILCDLSAFPFQA